MLRDDCPLCRRFQGKEADPGGPLIETELVRAQHASTPAGQSGVYAGWLLVTPLRHVTSLAELTTEEAHQMAEVRTRLATALRDSTASHVYSAAVDRQALIRDRLRETADKLCEGSLTPLLTHLVGATNLAPEEIAMLRRLVEDHASEENDEGETT